MFKKLKSLGGGGKGRSKFRLDVTVAALEGLPEQYDKCRVVWARQVGQWRPAQMRRRWPGAGTAEERPATGAGHGHTACCVLRRAPQSTAARVVLPAGQGLRDADRASQRRRVRRCRPTALCVTERLWAAPRRPMRGYAPVLRGTLSVHHLCRPSCVQ